MCGVGAILVVCLSSPLMAPDLAAPATMTEDAQEEVVDTAVPPTVVAPGARAAVLGASIAGSALGMLTGLPVAACVSGLVGGGCLALLLLSPQTRADLSPVDTLLVSSVVTALAFLPTATVALAFSSLLLAPLGQSTGASLAARVTHTPLNRERVSLIGVVTAISSVVLMVPVVLVALAAVTIIANALRTPAVTSGPVTQVPLLVVGGVAAVAMAGAVLTLLLLSGAGAGAAAFWAVDG